MRSGPFIAVALTVVLLLVGAGTIYAYDEGREDEIARGVRIAGLDVGGLTTGEAKARVVGRMQRRLRRAIVVRARGRRFELVPRAAGVRADVDATVAEALRISRSGTVLERVWRGLTRGDLRADVEPEVTFDSGAVRRFADEVGDTTDRAPRDAEVRFTAAGLERRRERTGLRVDRRRLRALVATTLADPDADHTITARVRRMRPEVTTRRLARRYRTALVIDRGAYTLRLFKGLRLRRTYRIAVGRVGLETPAGLYDVQNKAVNPAWHVPDSAWAGRLAGKVIPGGVPENPIRARWMGIYDGAGIHGTDARASIGTNASHGCIRMLVEDVVELYDQVPVGTLVYIA